MNNKEKYCGIIPAFFACYDKKGVVDGKRVETFAKHLKNKGVKGLYVGGSSGECIYQTINERMQTLEHVMNAVGGELTVIAHVACNSTSESRMLATHAESLGVDAIAAIPPVYFHLPEYAIAEYWNDISNAAPNSDFIIYNIPQLAGTALTKSLLEEMLKNPRLIGVKNSSAPTQDIQLFKAVGGDDFIIFNGPDEQLVSGLVIGADGAIGGTYAIMPELYLKLKEMVDCGNIELAKKIQFAVNEIIYKICTCHGNIYSIEKEILRLRENIDIGDVHKPLPQFISADIPIINACVDMINNAVKNLL